MTQKMLRTLQGSALFYLNQERARGRSLERLQN